LDGDGKERTRETEEDAALLRKVAAESIVLLKNDNRVLPIDKTKVKKVAIVGGNAKAVILSGGGSAALKPSYFVSPYDGIVKALGEGVEVTYSEGARGMTISCDLPRTRAHILSVLDVADPGVGPDDREGWG
jgi:beta-glucosidase